MEDIQKVEGGLAGYSNFANQPQPLTPNYGNGHVNTGFTQNYAQPMTHQPTHAQPMVPLPAPMPGVPRGLEYLTQIDQLLIKQKIELFEMLTNFEFKNKYEIKNSMGQVVYKAVENSGCCERQCCGPNRGFQIIISDNHDVEILKLERPLDAG